MPLSHYLAVVKGTARPFYLGCKEIPIDVDLSAPDEALWRAHDEGIRRRERGREPAISLLDLKIELASRILRSCHLCERRCGVDRLKGVIGRCGVGESRIASHFIHWGEEPQLVPSYTIFFSGCPFSCVYCQNWDISQYPTGIYIEPKDLVRMIGQGVKNVNWVGGEPTPNLPYILTTLKRCHRPVAQLWNSNMYCGEATMKLLEGVIDLYLTDFKYGNDSCAMRLSDAPDYWRVTTRNHRIAERQGDLLIRHLVLPGHAECCTRPVLEWIAAHLKNPLVNVMGQYRPEWRAYEYEEINRYPSPEEVRGAREIAKELGLTLVES